MKLKKILELDQTELKQLKKTDENSYEVYRMFMTTFVNTHSETKEFKRKLGLKLLQEHESDIIKTLSDKIENKKEKTLDEQIAMIEKRIENLTVKLEDLQSN